MMKHAIRVVTRTDTKPEVNTRSNQHRWNGYLQKQSVIPVATVNEKIKANERKKMNVKEDAMLVYQTIRLEHLNKSYT